MKKLILLALFSAISATAQNGYWQQQADYKMDVSMDVKTFKYKGSQTIEYTNNSPDTLKRVFYHLYNNAFQPGSEMDIRIQSIKDPDGRMVTKTKGPDGKDIVKSRIAALKPEEIGYLKINNFKQDGASASAKTVGTILEVTLAKPILPKSKSTFTLDFDAQVPVQIRRSGRNNSEGVDLSMAQWYPKMCEYDFQGWHTDPYIAREFYGVWGNFDVKITIDKDYVLGGTGYLQNPNEIGHGYQDKGVTVTYPKKAKTLTWHFLAPMVHDFTWAADPKYNHDIYDGPNGVKLHFLWLDNPEFNDNWKKLQPVTAQLMEFYNRTVGDYPYKQYSVIQGGDGGMEYGMCTLILGTGKLDGLIGVTMHEMAHSWFQFVLATNESKNAWMDEGFTSWLEGLGEDLLATEKQANPFAGSYKAYNSLANSGREQPLSTHADRYDENRVYSIGAYVKGCLFLSQLEYVIGRDILRKAVKNYYRDFKFKHPTPNDIKREAEKVSGAILDWYLVDWTQTTNTIDYGIKSVNETADGTSITLERIGRMPMPIDLIVEYENGTREYFYIPLRMMSFEKPSPYQQMKRTVSSDWAWAMPNYELKIPKTSGKVKSVQIDPSGYMADAKPENNIFKK
ncbi:MAG: M1 family peptidase [Flavobacterium sp.]|uniref:M1 family metallopeptidase n=1 Tax=Flavobacterium sp. TaxID=239 RepID=UPI00121310C6|nr:M1 family metallopeptidase [Flavobacterium sp.]RZJ67969.1 MAG: M1 family peptidase [Flavobacterium sp.]